MRDPPNGEQDCLRHPFIIDNMNNYYLTVFEEKRVHNFKGTITYHVKQATDRCCCSYRRRSLLVLLFWRWRWTYLACWTISYNSSNACSPGNNFPLISQVGYPGICFSLQSDTCELVPSRLHSMYGILCMASFPSRSF